MSSLSLAPPSRMSAPVQDVRAPSPWTSALAGAIGLGLIAALAPLRHVWVGSLVSVALLLTVPGVLALRALRVPSPAVAAFPIYVPLASLLVLIIGGLAGDLIGPQLGIHRPLLGATPLVSVIALSLILLAAGATAPQAAVVPWRRLLGMPSLLLPAVLPVAAAASAVAMNNGHGAIAARITAGAGILVFLESSSVRRR